MSAPLSDERLAEIRVSGDTHTSYRVFCRNGKESCDVMPRQDKTRAVATAREHVVNTGHRADVVKVRFETVMHVEVRQSSILSDDA